MRQLRQSAVQSLQHLVERSTILGGRVIKRSFFDAVSIASMERMHSQMIAWILSADCEAISPDSKSAILAGMCGVPAQELGNLKRCTTEWEHIDVVVETEKSVVFIENKIKSSQGQRQLNRYDSVIEEAMSGGFEGRLEHKLLLSLVGERPEVGSWRGVSYGDLVKKLDSAPLAKGPNEDATIVRAYVASLKRLTGAVEKFRRDPDQFGNVFEQGNVTRAQKSNLQPCDNSDCQYIRDMQLETVLQRLYLDEISHRIGAARAARLVMIGETRGVALLDIKEPNALHPVNEGGYTFDWGIQFQGKSVKIQFELGWHGCGVRKEEPDDMRAYMKDNVFGRIESFARQPNMASFWRFNRPTALSGATYCSISRPKGQLRWGEAVDVAVESYRASLNEALDVAAELSDYLARTQPGGNGMLPSGGQR